MYWFWWISATQLLYLILNGTFLSIVKGITVGAAFLFTSFISMQVVFTCGLVSATPYWTLSQYSWLKVYFHLEIWQFNVNHTFAHIQKCFACFICFNCSCSITLHSNSWINCLFFQEIDIPQWQKLVAKSKMTIENNYEKTKTKKQMVDGWWMDDHSSG